MPMLVFCGLSIKLVRHGNPPLLWHLAELEVPQTSQYVYSELSHWQQRLRQPLGLIRSTDWKVGLLLDLYALTDEQIRVVEEAAAG